MDKTPCLLEMERKKKGVRGGNESLIINLKTASLYLNQIKTTKDKTINLSLALKNILWLIDKLLTGKGWAFLSTSA